MTAEVPSPAPWGQDTLLERIGRTVAADRLPQSLLLHGPEGVGKRRLALWVAMFLQCESASDAGPCRACRSCRLAGRLEHPDVHLHTPMPRPKRASSRARLREAIERQREERLERLRDDLDARLDEGEVTGIYLAATENLRAQASRRPAMGRRSVFIVTEADRMVPQSSSPEAANAFLKLLEEPPDFAWLVLTSSRPAALLPTIRSRTAALRVPPLSEARVVDFLVQMEGADPETARAVALRAEGSVGRARSILLEDEGEAWDAADRLLSAALAGSARARLEAASEYSARGARATLQPALEALRVRIRDLLCQVTEADEGTPAGRSRPLATGRALSTRGLLGAFEAVEAALEGTGRNLNPQSTVAVLLSDVDRALADRTRGTQGHSGV